MKKIDVSAEKSRKSIRQAQSINFVLCALCLLSLVFCRLILERIVYFQFSQIGDPTSIQAYITGLAHAWEFLTVLCLLWWFGAANGGKMAWGAQWRDTIERSSFSCSLVVTVVAFIGTFLVSKFFGTGGISSANNFYYYPLGFIYILPVVFVCAMYVFPPVNISKVILPGNRYKVVTIVVVLLTVVLIVILSREDVAFGV